MRQSCSTAACLAASLALSASLPGVSLAQDGPPERDGILSPQYWDAFFSFEGKLGSDRNIGETDVLIPLTQLQDQLLFADFRFRFDDDESQEYNLGLGYRRLVTNNLILGGYGFYDHLISGNDNSFWQLTIGAEALLESYEFRANIYLPEDKESQFGPVSTGGILDGNTINFARARGVEKPLPGFDLEAGIRSPVKDIDAWFYAAYFHFDDSDFETVAGPRLRAEWNIDAEAIYPGAKITTGVQWQDDDVRGNQTFLTLAFRIPLGLGGRPGAISTPLPDWQPARMTRKVERDIDVVTGQRSVIISTEPATVPGTAGAQAFGAVDVVQLNGDAAAGAGTVADPTGDLIAAVNLGTPNIFVLGSQTRFDLASTINLQDGQSLLGGGSVVQIADASGTETAFFRVPGSRAVISQDDTLTDVVRAANDTVIDQIALVNGRSAVVIDGVDNVEVRGFFNPFFGESDTVFVGQTGDPIQIVNGATNVLIDNVAIRDQQATSNASVRINGGATSNVTLNNLVVTGPAVAGIVIENNASSVAVSNVTVTGSGTTTDVFRITNAADVSLENVFVQGPTLGNRLMNANTVDNLDINGFSAVGFAFGTGPAGGFDNGDIFLLDNVTNTDVSDTNTITNLDLAPVTVTSTGANGFSGLLVIRNSDDITFNSVPAFAGDVPTLQTSAQITGALVRIEDSGATNDIIFEGYTFDTSLNTDALGEAADAVLFAIDNSNLTFNNNTLITRQQEEGDPAVDTFVFTGATINLDGNGNTHLLFNPTTGLEPANPVVNDTATTINGQIDFGSPDGFVDTDGFTAN
ncbi:inverse autotransporter beta domain-containing protein [Mucisphaera sp.]|uniref:inverse autotransporter beta domain-containing protein n=1 Tax=Mucisphaera sp. TaxID=2913024 RepID=UPI003D127357